MARRPTSKAAMTARGDPRAKDRPEDPTPLGGHPSCPAALDACGKIEFKRLCRELAGLGVLASADRGVIVMTADAFSRWAAARKAVNEHGVIIQSPGGAKSLNPAMRAARDAAGQVVRFSTELGLTPASRTRTAAAVQRPDGGEDSLEAFMASAPTFRVGRGEKLAIGGVDFV